MDDFTPDGDDFDQVLQTLENVLERCITTKLCLSNVKCHMMMTEGVILGHYFSAARIQVDPAKIQEFDITIKDCLGKENLVPDFLSQVPKINYPLVVDEQFPNEHLFSVAVKTPWYADVANYLAVGKLPRCIREHEIYDILKACHDEHCGGHFTNRRMGHKLL
eukprot:PITA_05201